MSELQAAGSVSAYFAGLVHPPARRVELQRLQQQDFIASKLIFVALALAGAPILVALRGAPSPGEAGAFTLVLLQLLPVMLVARRGWLALAQELSVIGLLGIGAVAALLPDAHPFAAAAWFAAAAVEALIGCDGLLGCLLGACSIASAVVAACLALVVAPAALPAEAAFVAAAAALPALAAAWRGRRAGRETTFAMAEALRRHAALAALADVVAIDADAAGRVGQASANAPALLGIACEELHGRGLFERILVADRPAFLKVVSDAAHGAVHGGKVAGAVVRLRCSSAPAAPAGGVAEAPRHAAVELRAVPDGNGVVLVLRDVDAVRPAKDADAASAETIAATPPQDLPTAKTDRELRASLNAVIGFSEILASHTLRPVEAEKQREYARIILASGRHLLSVVDTIPPETKTRALDLAPRGETSAVAPLRSPPDAAPFDAAPFDECRPTRDIRMKRSA